MDCKVSMDDSRRVQLKSGAVSAGLTWLLIAAYRYHDESDVGWRLIVESDGWVMKIILVDQQGWAGLGQIFGWLKSGIRK